MGKLNVEKLNERDFAIHPYPNSEDGGYVMNGSTAKLIEKINEIIDYINMYKLD